MKNTGKYQIWIFCLVFLFTGGCSWRDLGLFYGKYVLEKQEKVRSVDEEISLIVTDGDREKEHGLIRFKGLDQTGKLLQKLSKENKPVIIYIHGKGKEEFSGFDPRVIWRIESVYNVKVLAFHWLSYDPIGYNIWPQFNAKASSPYLIHFLKILQRIKIREQIDQPVTLLFHSMGARILMYALQDNANNKLCADNQLDFSQMADRILLSAPETPSNDHEDWLRCLNRDVWITVNEGDMMLAAVEAYRSSPRLGNDARIFNKKSPGGQFHYLDLSQIEGGYHEYALGHSTKSGVKLFKNFYYGKPLL